MDLISKEELAEIVELAEGVPECFQEICFEILLQNSLGYKPSKHIEQGEILSKDDVEVQSRAVQTKFVLPIDVKAFLSQYGLDKEILENFFLIDNNEVRPIFSLTTSKKVEAQTQHALMMSLQNALQTGEFKVEIEALRTRCKDLKSYDSTNFSKHIKSRSNLYRETEGVEELVLSPDGKAELADLLEALA